MANSKSHRRKVILSSALTLIGSSGSFAVSPEIIAAAWRDPAFLHSLSAEVQKQIPENPAGTVQVNWHISSEVAFEQTCGTTSSLCSTTAASCSTTASSCSTTASSCSTTASSCSTTASNCSTTASSCSTTASTCSTTDAACTANTICHHG